MSNTTFFWIGFGSGIFAMLVFGYILARFNANKLGDQSERIRKHFANNDYTKIKKKILDVERRKK